MISRFTFDANLASRARSVLRRAIAVSIAGFCGAAVVTGGSLAWHHFEEAPEWEVHEVRIEGNDRASTPALMHLANIRETDHLLDLDLEKARIEVERHPWVKKATVRRDYPSTVEIVVEEYEPMMLLALEHLYYVDADGTPFRTAQAEDLNYPILTGIRPDLAQNQPDHARAVIAGALRVHNAVLDHPVVGPDHLSEIHFSAEVGFELVLRSGSRLVFGIGNPQAPLDRLNRLIGVGLNLQSPQRVDLDANTVAVATPLSNPS